MKSIRLIARLDIKGPHLIKGIQLEGLRKLGDPNQVAEKYYQEGIDEIIYMDAVASLYQRDTLFEIVRRTTENVFVPITVGGGIRSVEDAEMVLRSGADKVAVNTATIKTPGLISDIAKRFGNQCMVLSIEAKKVAKDNWEAYCDAGREKTGLNVIDWAKRAVDLGAGEILLTSVDQDGTMRGFDFELIDRVTNSVSVPVIASGGMGSLSDLEKLVSESRVSAIAVGSSLHYNRLSIKDIRNKLIACGVSPGRDDV